jgi:hypothetical protein
MAVTVHYLDDSGELQAKLLDCSAFHVRHTSANITTRLLDIIAEFDISLKVTAVVSDNAANVVKAIDDAGIVGLRCYAHTLNLSVTAALKKATDFEDLRHKISELVTFTRRSCNAKEDFAACQLRLGLTCLALVPDQNTRWNSTFLMLKRFLAQKEAVILFQASNSAQNKNFSFSQEEWKMATDAMNILEPAYEATIELSGEHYVSGSKLIPMVKALLTWYSDTANQEQELHPEQFKHKLASNLYELMNSYMGNTENIIELALATLCDPRYKREAFQGVGAATNAVGYLKQEMKNCVPEDQPVLRSTLSQVGSGSALWRSFDREVYRSSERNEDGDDLIEAELEKYLKMSNLPRSANPLKWWANVGREVYPKIHEVSKRYLVIPATSVPSERVFSLAGEVLSKKRCAMSDKNAATLIFLKENLTIKKRKN